MQTLRLIVLRGALFLSLLFVPLAGHSVAPQCLFENYSTLNGMPHNRVSDLYTDSQGFLWICTWYGVSRFDGYTFKNYSTVPGDRSPLSHNRFLSVSEDSCSHLWFKVYNNHIYRFNRFTEQFEDPFLMIPGAESRHFRAAERLHDRHGHTWVVIPGEGVVCFHSEVGEQPVQVDHWLTDAYLRNLTATALDPDGAFWLAAADGQLCRIAPHDKQPHFLGSAGEPVLKMLYLEGHCYFLTPSRLLRCGDKDEQVQLVARGREFSTLEYDASRDCLYVGSRKGEISVLTEPTGAAPTFSRVEARGKLSRIRALHADSHGILWITTPEAGITRYDPERGDYKHFYQEPYTISYNIDTLPELVESADRLWIKMNCYGFGYYDRENDRVEPFYNDPKRAECLMSNGVVRFEVQEDVLWLSTFHERGLRRAILLKQTADVLSVESRFEQQMVNEVRALMTDSHRRIWVGTRIGELLCYDSKGHLLQHYPDRQGDLGMIYALKEDSEGRIWVGTRNRGLFLMEPAGDRYRITRHYDHDPHDAYSISSSHIYSIEEDDLGRIWVATYGGGINLFDRHTERFYHARNLLGNYPLSEADRVRWLLNDGCGRMLAATVDGLVVFRPEENLQQIDYRLVRKIAGDNNSLGNNDIIHMLRDRQGRIWLATYGGGLNRIEGYREELEPRFSHYDMRDGLKSNICLSLAEDSRGDIWVATQNAVSKLEPERERISNYVLYENHTSASFSETAALATPDGEILFGSGSHLFLFRTEMPTLKQENYPLLFTGLRVGNSEVTVGPDSPLTESISIAERIDLSYDYSNFRIDFAVLDYAEQDEIGYMYLLEGYDHDWNVVGGTHSATYSNVPTGRYTLRVRAYSGSVEMVGAERTIQVVIHPPFWLSWWAKLLYVLLAVGAVVVVLKVVNSMQRIRQEAKMEQKMSDMKLQFFTNISHELRTPLTLILGGVDEVKKHENLTQRGAISLGLAEKNARRMLTMINQLLDFRKIVKEKMELKIARINLVPLVEDVIEDFRKLAEERGIQLLCTVSQRSIPVWVDIERMESVVYNLLSNAQKFTQDGGRVEVILTVENSAEEVHLIVRDNGVGIPRDQQSQIFERFHQASRSVAGQRGSGIGLSLCREIVALHGGAISVESRVGEGSTFTVRLKMGNSHFGEEQLSGSEGEGGRHAAYTVSDYTLQESDRRSDVVPPADSPRILLVDDNRELRLYMYNNLVEYYRVLEAEDGVQALETILREAPDLVVTDLMMPRMDGIELVNRVRSDFSVSHIPIIMLTAKHSPNDRIKAMEYGADGYITKPFSMELLEARIENLLKQRRSLFEHYSTHEGTTHRVNLNPEEVVVTDKDEAFMSSVVEWLKANSDNSNLTIDQLSTHLGLSRTTLYNKLKGLTGHSPVELIKEYRLKRSLLLLKTGQLSVSEVAYKVGFSDPGYFSRCFKEAYRIAPAELLKRLREGVDIEQLLGCELNNQNEKI